MSLRSITIKVPCHMYPEFDVVCSCGQTLDSGRTSLELFDLIEMTNVHNRWHRKQLLDSPS
jgi:hypothetical protein